MRTGGRRIIRLKVWRSVSGCALVPRLPPATWIGPRERRPQPRAPPHSSAPRRVAATIRQHHAVLVSVLRGQDALLHSERRLSGTREENRSTFAGLPEISDKDRQGTGTTRLCLCRKRCPFPSGLPSLTLGWEGSLRGGAGVPAPGARRDKQIPCPGLGLVSAPTIARAVAPFCPLRVLSRRRGEGGAAADPKRTPGFKHPWAPSTHGCRIGSTDVRGSGTGRALAHRVLNLPNRPACIATRTQLTPPPIVVAAFATLCATVRPCESGGPSDGARVHLEQ